MPIASTNQEASLVEEVEEAGMEAAVEGMEVAMIAQMEEAGQAGRSQSRV